jgi:CPA1 family monovalent cation:H+ antiporter
MRRFRSFSPGVVTILTWGGLRGGISVALALSLPASETRDLLVTITYCVVVFSVLVQGLTLGPVVRALAGRADVEMERTELPDLIPDDEPGALRESAAATAPDAPRVQS